MDTPFSIQIFSVTGDPEGIRIITKTNWSGVGVVFPRSQLGQLKSYEFLKSYMERAAVYILVGEVADQTVYIGEADPVSDRLKDHNLQKQDWQWAVFFVDALHGLGKTEVQYLEAELVRLGFECGTAIVLNKNKPTQPAMSPAAKAAVSVFLREFLSIVPLIGIRAFTVNKQDLSPTSEPEPPKTFDTIVVPAHQDGFKEVFLDENCWYAIKIQAKFIPQLKYIAAYVTAPTSAITHVAEIESISSYEGTNKLIVKFKGPAKPIGPIPLGTGGIEMVPRSPRYTKYVLLGKAKMLADVWK